MPVTYTHGPSTYISFDEDHYSAEFLCLLGTTFYRLQDIHREDDGSYTATFDILYFAEAETAFPETSPNTRAVIAHAVQQLGYTEEEVLSSGPKFKAAVRDLFLQPDYAEQLDLSGTVTIQFTLTGEAQQPFYYLSCKRQP